MDYSVEKLGKKLVIGIKTRTSNEKGDIPSFWERFFTENLAEKIPNKINNNLMAVYTDYEGDYTKPFGYIIGCEVSSLKTIPEMMVGLEIPEATYALFKATGEFPKSMGVTWQAIWNANIERAYTTDFEIYRSDFNPTKNPEISIYISLKNSSL